MPSNPFDEFFSKTQAPPQSAAPAPESAPTQAAPAAGGNPFDEFFDTQKPAVQNATATQTPATQAPASAPTTPTGNPFDEFFASTAAPSVGTPSTTTAATKEAPSYEDRFGVGESILSRPISTYFGIPEYGEGATGIKKGAEKFFSALTSPVSLGLMLATGGVASVAEAGVAMSAAELAEAGAAGAGEATAETWGAKVLNWVAENKGPEAAAKIGKWAGTIDKVSTAGFSYDMIRGVASQIPQIQSDIKAGDWEAAQEHITSASLGAVAAAASVNHLTKAFGIEKYNFTPDRKALGEYQSSVEQAKLEARNIERLAQPILEKHAKEMGVSAHDLDVAMKWRHEAGGLKNELPEGTPVSEAAPLRDTIPANPFSSEKGEVVITPADGGSRIEHSDGSMELTSPDDKTVQVKGVIGAKKGIGQRLYDTAIQNAVKRGADTFKSDTVLTEEGKNAWQRLSARYDVKREADGSYSIDLTKLREPAVEAGSDTVSTLQSWKKDIQNLDNISPKDKIQMLKNVEIALSLPKELRDMTEKFRPFYDEHWERAKTAGLVHPDAEAREHYAGNRQYNPEDETQNAFRPSESTLRATKKPAQLKSRSFDNMIDALKKGYVPKHLGMVESAGDYERSMGAAHGLVKAEEVFTSGDDTDGRPIAVEPSRIRNIPQTLESGRVVQRRGIRFDDTSAIDPDSGHIIYHEGKPYLDVTDHVEGPKVFKRFRVTDVGFAKDDQGNIKLDSAGEPVDLPVRKQTALMFHPDHIDRINQAFDDSSWVRRTPWMNSVLKTSQTAKKTLLALSPFHYATEGLRGLQTGLTLHEIFHPDEIDPAGLAATKGTAHGLVLLGDHLERSAYRAAADSEASGGGGLISKVPILRDIQSKAEEHLFGSWLPRMKAAAFEKMSRDLREQKPNWEDHQIYSTAARLTNATFGGMNWKQLGVSASTVDVWRMFALAPDFTGSQIDYTMQAFKPGGSVVAKSFGRMLFYNMLVAQAINLMIHGTVHMEHPFGVVGPDEKKVWSMRTMPEDVWRSLTETTSFAKNRLNPLVKTGVEMLYDRNEEGKKMSDEQLIGDAIRNVSPISLQGAGAAAMKALIPDISKKFKTGNKEDTFLESVLRGVGISPSANRTAAEKLASQRLNDHLPAGISDPGQVERHHNVLDAADQIRSGHSVDLHGFTPTERRQIMTAGREDILLSKFGRLNMNDALDVWQIATQEEKQKLLMDLLKKRTGYVKKLSPKEREDDDTFKRLRAMGLAR
jgi:hypothetical protein